MSSVLCNLTSQGETLLFPYEAQLASGMLTDILQVVCCGQVTQYTGLYTICPASTLRFSSVHSRLRSLCDPFMKPRFS